jgi:hypothetical protein
MNRVSILLLLLVGLLSCDGRGPMYQATRVHVPMHTRSGQGAFSFYAGLGGDANIKSGMDASYAITNHLAVKAGGMMAGAGSAYHYDLAAGAFTNDRDTNVSLAGWLIFGREAQMSHDRDALHTTKYGFQAELGLHGRNVEGVGALRFMWLNFPANDYFGPSSGDYVEPTVGIRLGGEEMKFELMLSLVTRTDRERDGNPGWVTVGMFGKIN